MSKRSIGVVMLTAAAGVALASCSDDGNNSPQALESVQGVDGEIAVSDDTPDVEGFEVDYPDDEAQARSAMCESAAWWLNPETSPEDREEVAPYLMAIAEDYAGIDEVTDMTARGTVDMVRTGYTVNPDDLTVGQNSARVNCGITVGD